MPTTRKKIVPVVIDADMPTNPKIVMVGERSAWLYFCSICYAKKHRTCGFIANQVVHTLVKNPTPAMIAALVNNGLWEPVQAEGYNIHDYRDYNSDGQKLPPRPRNLLPIPPPKDELKALFTQIGRPDLTERFFNYYAQRDWRMKNGNPLIDVSAAAHKWAASPLNKDVETPKQETSRSDIRSRADEMERRWYDEEVF